MGDSEAASINTSPTLWASRFLRASPSRINTYPLKVSWSQASSPGSKPTAAGCVRRRKPMPVWAVRVYSQTSQQAQEKPTCQVKRCRGKTTTARSVVRLKMVDLEPAGVPAH